MLPPPETATSSNGFQDRKTGLVVFGIFTILMGLVCALFIPFMLFGQAMAAKSGPPQNTQVLLPAMMMYGLLAVALIWLGIGSAMARRWARALLLIFSWNWLLMGVITLGMMSFVLPQIMQAAAKPGQPELSSAAQSAVMIIPLVMIGILFIALPIAWLLFYRSPHVKATCEARDPVVRWTDRCPLPVLAISLWLLFSCASMFLMAGAFKGVIPVFGMFVTGPLGSALYVLLGLVWAYSAWALYKLEWRGWWLVVATLSLFALSGFMTYSRHDVNELYVLMGYPEQQIAEIQQFSFLQGHAMAWFSLSWMLPLLIYMLYLRRFLPRRNP